MKLFGYWATVPEMLPEDELRLSLHWSDRWRAAGWEPFVLTEWQARQHPMFVEYQKAVSLFPSINPPLYEYSCWVRWLALAQVGGGFMSDFDLIPYPTEAIKLFDINPEQAAKLQMFQRVSPSFVHASKKVCEQLCELFMTGKYGRRKIGDKDHASDQYALENIGEKFPDLIERHDLVKGYCDDHWETAPFVHYSNSATMPRGKTPRWKHIPDLRK